MAENRIDPTAAPSSPSPTGTPIVPTKAIPWLAVVGSALLALQASINMPPVANSIITGALFILGVVSPGWRK